MNRRVFENPSFDFEAPTTKPTPESQPPPKPLTEREAEYQEALTSGAGWCGDCDMQLGTGSCVRCQRIKFSAERRAKPEKGGQKKIK